jgi:hypothetical protein
MRVKSKAYSFLSCAVLVSQLSVAARAAENSGQAIVAPAGKEAVLTDGTRILADGTIVSPDGTKKLPNGDVVFTNGTVLKPEL